MLAAMPSAGRKRQTLFDKSGPPSRDRAIAALAEHQHGAVATRQLLALGLTRQAIAHRAGDGRLHRVHHGVYAVGHAGLTGHGRLMAAVLAGGEGAVLSHASAAALWDLRRSDAERMDVSVRRSGRQKRDGLRLHRPRTLHPDEITTHDGIPVTTPARTVLDLAAPLRRRPLERILDRVEVLELADYPALHRIADAHPGHRGAPKLRAALDTHHAGTTLTRSELEERFSVSAAPTACPRRSSTRGRAARRSTSASRATRSSSRRTAGRTTAPARRSRTTAPATRTTPAPAIAPCASRTVS